MNLITTFLASNLIWMHGQLSIFNSSQIIHIIEYNMNNFNTKFVYSNEKFKTSDFGVNNDALVSINGGYHAYGNPMYNGSITKFRVDSVDLVTNNSMLESYGLSDENANGVLAIKNKNVYIFKSSEKFSIIDDMDSFLYLGPLLLYNNKKTRLKNIQWNSVRNPRTVVCISQSTVKYVIIDGRRPGIADGMNLKEIQSLLLKKIKCTHAINLDGGGSTTLYIKSYGIVNTPMSKSGNNTFISIERNVYNALIIK